jgi:hypothetical protein
MNTQQQKIKKTKTTPPNPAFNHLTQPPKQSDNKAVAAFCLSAQQNLALFLKHKNPSPHQSNHQPPPPPLLHINTPPNSTTPLSSNFKTRVALSSLNPNKTPTKSKTRRA